MLTYLPQRPEDSEIEVMNMTPGIGEMICFPSVWGHWAGGPGDSVEDVKWLDEMLRKHFAGVR
jgi:homoserine O-acetyltransferase